MEKPENKPLRRKNIKAVGVVATFTEKELQEAEQTFLQQHQEKALQESKSVK